MSSVALRRGCPPAARRRAARSSSVGASGLSASLAAAVMRACILTCSRSCSRTSRACSGLPPPPLLAYTVFRRYLQAMNVVRPIMVARRHHEHRQCGRQLGVRLRASRRACDGSHRFRVRDDSRARIALATFLCLARPRSGAQAAPSGSARCALPMGSRFVSACGAARAPGNAGGPSDHPGGRRLCGRLRDWRAAFRPRPLPPTSDRAQHRGVLLHGAFRPELGCGRSRRPGGRSWRRARCAPRGLVCARARPGLCDGRRGICSSTTPVAFLRLFTSDPAVVTRPASAVLDDLRGVSALRWLPGGRDRRPQGAWRYAHADAVQPCRTLAGGSPARLYVLCFWRGWGVIGLWVGLSLGLILVGIALTRAWARAARDWRLHCGA